MNAVSRADVSQGNVTVRLIEAGELDRQLERIALAVRRRWGKLRAAAEEKAGVKTGDGDTLARGEQTAVGLHIPARVRREMPPQINRVLKPGDRVVVNDRGPWRFSRLRCVVIRATAKSARVQPYCEPGLRSTFVQDMARRGIKLYSQIHGKTLRLNVLDVDMGEE